MGNICEDMWVEILRRLSSEKDLVLCMKVSRLWHRITSEIWVRRFWVQSPPLGLFFRSATTSATVEEDNTVLRRMNYISLYNYYDTRDNLEINRYLGGKDKKLYMREKRSWQYFDRQWYRSSPGPSGELTHPDRDEYLNGCNGLLLLMKSATNQFYVCNPITGQQIAIPKACVHDDQQFCAALAFDPLESAHHFKVVRFDYSASDDCVLLDIFSSEYGLWFRHRLQIDPGFTEGFKTSKLGRHFVYFRGKLYSIALSWNLLCIDLNTVAASALKLPEDAKTGTMGCLGVSMDSLCYMKRMPQHLAVWYYGDESGEWILRYRFRCRILGYEISGGLGYDCDDSMQPFGISPTSDLLFFGNPNLIVCMHLKSETLKFVCETTCKIDPPAFLVLRAWFVPFYTRLNKRNYDISTSLNRATACGSTLILSAERPYGKQEDDTSVEVIDVKLYATLPLTKYSHDTRPLVFPSEIMGMHLELAEISPFLLEIGAMNNEVKST